MAQFSAVNPSVSSMAAHKGQKVNFKSNAAKEYQSFLEAQQQSVIQSIKSFDKSFKADMSYTAAFNGFAGIVSKSALDKLSSLSTVKAVYPDLVHHAQMDASLDLIGAVQTWEQFGGKESAGAGVKVAIIDSGIRPENPLFSGENFTAPDAATLSLTKLMRGQKIKAINLKLRAIPSFHLLMELTQVKIQSLDKLFLLIVLLKISIHS